MATLTIESDVVAGFGNEYSPDSRTGSQSYHDGAGLHEFQISDPNGTNAPGQDVYYRFITDGTDPRTVAYSACNAGKKVYSLDGLYEFNGGLVLKVQTNDAPAGQSSVVNAHYASVNGVTVTPPHGGGNSGGSTLGQPVAIPDGAKSLTFAS